MNRRKTAISIAALLVVAIVILAVLLMQKDRKVTEVSTSAGLVGGAIVSVEDCNIPVGAWKAGPGWVGPDGIKTILPPGYVQGTPLVEIYFLRRTLAGEIEPLVLRSVGMSTRGGFGPTYGLQKSHGMRFAIGEDKTGELRALEPGSTYTISDYSLVNPPHSENTVKPNPGFRVPENLPANTVYRVNLVIKDEMREQELLAEKEAKKKQLEKIAKEEAITVKFAKVPEGGGAVLYFDGERSREGIFQENAENTLVIKGPNRLGGELVVMVSDPTSRCWAYIEELKSRSVVLPKDADIVLSKDKLVELPLSFEKEDVAKFGNYKYLMFYKYADAAWPLSAIGLRNLASEDPNAIKQQSVKLLPGTYYVRVGKPRGDETPIGTVTVEAKDPAPYSVKLPD